MKFKCTCGNVINTTDGFCKGAYVLHTKSEYILWIKFICDLIPMKEHPGFKRTFFAMNVKGILFFTEKTYMCLNPALLKRHYLMTLNHII